MARQEANNTFQDGMIKDLNPINTPNTVLTDCLNGTLITYNGNEFILQNDLGNYKLENCKLPVNFIPVGIKSYGDILYIVSYNPLTNETEIGSYPAPQSIYALPEKAINEFQLNAYNINNTVKYQEIEPKSMFLFVGEDDIENYKLYPGDQYFLSISKEMPFKYQHLNYYIIDDDRKTYDLDDSLIVEHTSDTGEGPTDWGYVNWETPGWLAAKYVLDVPDKFNVNVRTLNVPEFILNENTTRADNTLNVELKLSTQTIISDKKFQDHLKDSMSDLKIRVEVQTQDGTPANININSNEINVGDYIDIGCEPYYYQDDILTAFNNINVAFKYTSPVPVENKQLYSLGSIVVTLTPIIQSRNGTLIYDQFATTLTYNLDTLKDSKSILIADSVYKWSCDSNSCTISFDVEGPFINVKNIFGRYEIKKLGYSQSTNKNILTPTTEIAASGDIDNFVFFGQNTLDILWNEKFVKESGFYQLDIIIEEQNDAQQSEEITRKSLLLIPSEVFNGWFGELDSYLTGITAPDWIGKWLDTVDVQSTLLGFDILDKFNIEDESKNAVIEYWWNDDVDDIKTWSINNDATDFYNIILEHFKEIDSSIDSAYITPQSFSNETLNFRLKLSSIKTVEKRGDFNLQYLPGELWQFDGVLNIKLDGDVTLTIKKFYKNSSEDVTQSEFDLDLLSPVMKITFTSDPHPIFIEDVNARVYPFKCPNIKDNTYYWPIFTYHAKHVDGQRPEQDCKFYYNIGHTWNNDTIYEAVNGDELVVQKNRVWRTNGIRYFPNLVFDYFNRVFDEKSDCQFAVCRLLANEERGEADWGGWQTVIFKGPATDAPGGDPTVLASGTSYSVTGTKQTGWGLLFKAANLGNFTTSKATVFMQITNGEDFIDIKNTGSTSVQFIEEFMRAIAFLQTVVIKTFSNVQQTRYVNLIATTQNVVTDMQTQIRQYEWKFTFTKLGCANGLVYRTLAISQGKESNLVITFDEQEKTLTFGNLLKETTDNLPCSTSGKGNFSEPILLEYKINSQTVGIFDTLVTHATSFNNDSQKELDELSSVSQGGKVIQYEDWDVSNYFTKDSTIYNYLDRLGNITDDKNRFRNQFVLDGDEIKYKNNTSEVVVSQKAVNYHPTEATDNTAQVAISFYEKKL